MAFRLRDESKKLYYGKLFRGKKARGAGQHVKLIVEVEPGSHPKSAFIFQSAKI